MKICFVTSNENKLREAEDILGLKLEQANIDVREIQSLDVEEVATEKAKEAYKIVKKPVIVEDTGLYIESLNGFPGALIKWVMKSIGNEGICKMVEEDRKALARTCVCFYDGSELKVFTGEIKGRISDRPRGESGFGWDAIFIPEGYEETFAELGMDVKNKISMRRIAFIKLKEYLESKSR